MVLVRGVLGGDTCHEQGYVYYCPHGCTASQDIITACFLHDCDVLRCIMRCTMRKCNKDAVDQIHSRNRGPPMRVFMRMCTALMVAVACIVVVQCLGSTFVCFCWAQQWIFFGVACYFSLALMSYTHI